MQLGAWEARGNVVVFCTDHHDMLYKRYHLGSSFEDGQQVCVDDDDLWFCLLKRIDDVVFTAQHIHQGSCRAHFGDSKVGDHVFLAVWCHHRNGFASGNAAGDQGMGKPVGLCLQLDIGQLSAVIDQCPAISVGFGCAGWDITHRGATCQSVVQFKSLKGLWIINIKDWELHAR